MSDPASIDDRIEAAVAKAEGGAQIYHDVANGAAGVYVSTESGPLPTIAEWYALNEEVLGDLPALQQAVADIANKTDVTKGAFKVGYRGRTVHDRLDDVINIADAPYGVKGDNTVQDRLNLIAALDAGAAAGKVVVVPPKRYEFLDWIPIPDKCKLFFVPGARWVLTAPTTLGGFLCGGYTNTTPLVQRPFTEAEIYGLDIDCGGIAGENGFSAVNAVGVRLFNPKIRNSIHSTVKLGGRAFQFEGAIVDGIHIYAPYISDCSIGINSQADAAAGTHIARDINYYDVIMHNVDVPFNVDGQYANPQNGSSLNASTFVHGARLFNCGKLTFPGNAGAQGGGIICGDRGFGLSISGLRVYNTPTYGAIGALVRGTMFNVQLHDVGIEVSSVTAIFDFTQPGFGSPSGASFPNLVIAEDIRFKGNIDYIVKTGGGASRLGACKFMVDLDQALATPTGIIDIAGVTTAYLDVVLTDNGFKRTGLRTLAELFTAGNSLGLCLRDYQEGTWTPTDGSGAGLAFTNVAGSYVRNRRLVTVTGRLTYPTTADVTAAVISGLPFAAVNLTHGGAAAIAYKQAANLFSGQVQANTSTIALYTSAGVTTKNNDMSTTTLIFTATYLAQ